MPQNKEYIDREWLIEHFDTMRQNMIMRQVDKYPAACAFAIEEIKDAPAADVVEVRHAKWDDNHKCTACGNEALLEEKPDTMAHGLNSLFFVDSGYCPNCGAKMDL